MANRTSTDWSVEVATVTGRVLTHHGLGEDEAFELANNARYGRGIRETRVHRDGHEMGVFRGTFA